MSSESATVQSSVLGEWVEPAGLPPLPVRDTRFRRTLLLTPGHHASRLSKALTLPVDAVGFDLEDGVAPSRKAEARQCIAHILRTQRPGHRERIVRINAPGSPDCDLDLAALPWGFVDALLVPKVESADQVRLLDERIRQLEDEAQEAGQNGASSPSQTKRPTIGLILTLETPRGVLRALEIADASPRTVSLFFGSGDYTLRTGGSLSVASLATARGLIVAAAAAAGLQALDAPYLEGLRDTEASLQDALRARDVGFSGKVVFHPDQIAPVNAAFTPTLEQAQQDLRVIHQFAQMQAKGEAVALIDGRFVALDLIPQLVRNVHLFEHGWQVAQSSPSSATVLHSSAGSQNQHATSNSVSSSHNEPGTSASSLLA